jgi:hypothetical protein
LCLTEPQHQIRQDSICVDYLLVNAVIVEVESRSKADWVRFRDGDLAVEGPRL